MNDTYSLDSAAKSGRQNSYNRIVEKSNLNVRSYIGN